MVWNTDTLTNDAAPTVDDVKLNALNAEQASLVTTTGQTPDQTINDQMGKGAAILASGSVDQYTISGGPGAYLATPIAPVTPISPGALFEGMRVRGVFNVTNTGGAMTINPNGIGATPVKLVDGTDPVAGDLLIGQQIDMVRIGVNFVVTTAVSSIVLGLVPPATAAEMEAAAANDKFVTPLNFIESIFAAKAWVLFDGTAPAAVIRDSQGVTSVNRVGGLNSGTWDIILTTPFASLDYVPVLALGGTQGAPDFIFNNFFSSTILSTTSCQVVSFTAQTFVTQDITQAGVAFFGRI